MLDLNDKTLVIIPSRIGSTRLPKKSLIKIGEKTMVERVAQNVLESGLTNVYVATDDNEIASASARAGVKSIITDPNCPSGTDRAFAALESLPDKSKYEYVINVQGDMPFISPEIIRQVAEKIWVSNCDIVTPVVRTTRNEAEGESNVKVVSTNANKALYFSRSMIPNSSEEFLYHVGVYGYKAKALEKFVRLSPSYLEKLERLEQLRALENGMSIEICFVETIPISIDTQADLAKAMNYYKSTI